MAIGNTLESKIAYRIKRSKACVFLREDFSDIGGYDQIGRVLRTLTQKGLIKSLGYGVYARMRKSQVTGNYIPEKPLPELARELLQKMKIQIAESSAEKLYNTGKTSQVPTGTVIAVKSRIVRRIGYNGRYISFEQVS